MYRLSKEIVKARVARVGHQNDNRLYPSNRHVGHTKRYKIVDRTR